MGKLTMGTRWARRVASALLWAGALAGIPAARATDDLRDLVLDLHETLAYRTSRKLADQDPSNVVVIGRTYYLRLSDLAIDAIALLNATGRFRISIYSNGGADEVDAVAEAIEGQIPGFRFHRTGPIRYAGFGGGKDLRDLGVEVADNLADAILADDKPRNAAPGQEANLAWIGHAHEDIVDFDAYAAEHAPARGGFWEASARAGGVPAALTREDWALERNKFAWLAGVCLAADELALESRISFSQAVRQLTRNPATSYPYPRSHPTQIALTRRGLVALGFSDLDPATDRAPAPPRIIPGVDWAGTEGRDAIAYRQQRQLERQQRAGAAPQDGASGTAAPVAPKPQRPAANPSVPAASAAPESSPRDSAAVRPEDLLSAMAAVARGESAAPRAQAPEPEAKEPDAAATANSAAKEDPASNGDPALARNEGLCRQVLRSIGRAFLGGKKSP